VGKLVAAAMAATRIALGRREGDPVFPAAGALRKMTFSLCTS
jgi:hypothetical protein